VDIIHDTGSLVSSQFCFEGAVEDGGEHPRVLGVRLEIYWKDKNWEAVVHFASALATLKPRYVKQEIFALAPLPPQSIEQGMVGPGLLAQILVSKYEYHQPLYRQEKMFRQQFGVELSRKTMGSWVEQAAELLKLVYRSIREDLLRGNYLPAAKNTQIKEFTPRACACG